VVENHTLWGGSFGLGELNLNRSFVLSVHSQHNK